MRDAKGVICAPKSLHGAKEKTVRHHKTLRSHLQQKEGEEEGGRELSVGNVREALANLGEVHFEIYEKLNSGYLR